MSPLHNRIKYEQENKKTEKKENRIMVDGVDLIVKYLLCMHKTVGSNLSTTKFGHGRTQP